MRAPTEMPPLLGRLTERKPETLDYLGVSYGLTSQLLRFVQRIACSHVHRLIRFPSFWRRSGFVPLYVRQTTSELTGEHTCVMVRGLNSSGEGELEWMGEFAKGWYANITVTFLLFSDGHFQTSGVVSLPYFHSNFPNLGVSLLSAYWTL